MPPFVGFQGFETVICCDVVVAAFLHECHKKLQVDLVVVHEKHVSHYVRRHGTALFWCPRVRWRC